MGSLVKSSLSGLSSQRAELAPKNIELKQFGRTYNGNFRLNFINALSGSQDFKNLNFTNFYLTNNILLDDVTTYTGDVGPGQPSLLPGTFFSTLNYSNSGNSYLFFRTASETPFRGANDTYNAQFYGATEIGESIGHNFEITIVDQFTCRVAFLLNNFRYYLVVADDPPSQHNLDADQKYVLFVGENKLPLSACNLEYNFTRYLDNSYINLLTTKNNIKYMIQSTGTDLVATSILNPVDCNPTEFITDSFVTENSFRLNQETNVTIPTPYNTSFVTYNSDEDGINASKSAFNLPSNYLFYSSSYSPKQNLNLFTLKNTANNNDQFSSSNNLLSTSSNGLFAQNLRTYTSIFTDIDSEKNEVLALNYVYNNFNIKVRSGTTIFNTPSSLKPFKTININDTKFADCGAFAFPHPWLADRVYALEDTSPEAENVSYLCTWLSAGEPGVRGKWVDRYYYPNFISLSAALSASGTYNATYDSNIERLLRTNLSLRESVIKKTYFDKKSDLIFEPNKRYKYERINKGDFRAAMPTSYLAQAGVGGTIRDYFRTINKTGGFALGFTIQNDTGDFIIRSSRNNINGGFEISKQNDVITLTFNLYDSSSTVISDFTTSFTIDLFAKNNIMLCFNAHLGICNLYLNTQKMFSFNTNRDQFITKNILFGNIFIHTPGNDAEILTNSVSNKYSISNLYLATQPLDAAREMAAVFYLHFNDIQDITISLPCGMRNISDTFTTTNTINTALKNKSNVVDINIKNLNISNNNIINEVNNTLASNIRSRLPQSTIINNINYIDYK